jgi:hypothetical protein
MCNGLCFFTEVDDDAASMLSVYAFLAFQGAASGDGSNVPHAA